MMGCRCAAGGQRAVSDVPLGFASQQPPLPVWLSLLRCSAKPVVTRSCKDRQERLCAFSHVQVRPEVQAAPAEQRGRRLAARLWPGPDAPGPGAAVLPPRCSGAGGGPGSVPVQRHRHRTCEPRASGGSEQRQGKSCDRKQTEAVHTAGLILSPQTVIMTPHCNQTCSVTAVLRVTSDQYSRIT